MSQFHNITKDTLNEYRIIMEIEICCISFMLGPLYEVLHIQSFYFKLSTDVLRPIIIIKTTFNL